MIDTPAPPIAAAPFDAYAPAEVAARVETIGVAKARLPLLSMFTLGVLAGGFIGLGLYYTVVASDAQLGFAAGRVLGGVVFSLGLVLVVVAVTAGRFHVYAVHTVDEAIELLGGVVAGEPAPDVGYPAGSVHARVDARLHELAGVLQRFNAPETSGRNGKARRNGAQRGAQHGAQI
jgi:hypothetical protein